MNIIDLVCRQYKRLMLCGIECNRAAIAVERLNYVELIVEIEKVKFSLNESG